MADLREDLSQVVALLVDDPRGVTVDEGRGDQGPQLELQVADGDLGKVIGRQGRTARALRQVIAARSARGDRPWELKILDD